MSINVRAAVFSAIGAVVLGLAAIGNYATASSAGVPAAGAVFRPTESFVHTEGSAQVLGFFVREGQRCVTSLSRLDTGDNGVMIRNSGKFRIVLAANETRDVATGANSRLRLTCGDGAETIAIAGGMAEAF